MIRQFQVILDDTNAEFTGRGWLTVWAFGVVALLRSFPVKDVADTL